MCPGGQVVASASEKGRVVTNGMSYHARSGRNANAAVVVSVGGEDFGNDPRKAIAFQRELEAGPMRQAVPAESMLPRRRTSRAFWRQGPAEHWPRPAHL